MDIKQLTEELDKFLEVESKFEIVGEYIPKIIDKLETVDINKIDIIMLQCNGTLDDCSLKYSDLTNRELVKKVIKDVEDVDIKNYPIKIYEKPILTNLGDMSEYSFRLYFGEVAIDDDGEYVDFCLDCIPENEEHFNNIIGQWQ